MMLTFVFSPICPVCAWHMQQAKINSHSRSALKLFTVTRSEIFNCFFWRHGSSVNIFTDTSFRMVVCGGGGALLAAEECPRHVLNNTFMDLSQTVCSSDDEFVDPPHTHSLLY